MRRAVPALALVALLAAPVMAQTRHVRVAVEFHQTGTASRDAAGAGGGVIVTERGGVRSRVRGGADRTEVRRRSTSGLFTLVQDGGEAALVVATQVPHAHLAFYRDYATGQGYLVSGVTFRDVGTALRVHARVLPDRQIRVRLTPTISWLSADSGGTIAFAEAATELVVPDGRPVVLAGSTTETHTLTRQILGIEQERARAETTVVLTATVGR